MSNRFMVTAKVTFVIDDIESDDVAEMFHYLMGRAPQDMDGIVYADTHYLYWDEVDEDGRLMDDGESGDQILDPTCIGEVR